MRLCYTSGDSNNFQYTGMHYSLSLVDPKGGFAPQGQPVETNNSSLASNLECSRLDYVFTEAGVTPTSGSQYQIEVDNVGGAGVSSGGGSGTSAVLGTPTFTYKD